MTEPNIHPRRHKAGLLILLDEADFAWLAQEAGSAEQHAVAGLAERLLRQRIVQLRGPEPEGWLKELKEASRKETTS